MNKDLKIFPFSIFPCFQFRSVLPEFIPVFLLPSSSHRFSFSSTRLKLRDTIFYSDCKKVHWLSPRIQWNENSSFDINNEVFTCTSTFIEAFIEIIHADVVTWYCEVHLRQCWKGLITLHDPSGFSCFRNFISFSTIRQRLSSNIFYWFSALHLTCM